jgi:hypothetical protein
VQEKKDGIPTENGESMPARVNIIKIPIIIGLFM